MFYLESVAFPLKQNLDFRRTVKLGGKKEIPRLEFTI